MARPSTSCSVWTSATPRSARWSSRASRSRGRRSTRASGALTIRAQGERQAPLPRISTRDEDWEGPAQPEYRESDPEAYDEMVRQDQEGKS